MAFALPPTLSDVRRSAAIRLNFGVQADAAPDMRALLDEFIRRAARELLLEANWTELLVETQTPLIVAQHAYDFPDNFDLGRLEAVFVTDADGREYRLEPDVRDYERNQWDSRGEEERSGMPLRYEVRDQMVYIYPAANDEYIALHFRGYMTPLPPYHEDDRIPVDREALIQKTVAIGKKHFTMPDAGQADLDLALYLNRLRPTESNNSGFRIGGHFSEKFRNTTRRRTGGSRSWGQDGWHEGWTPSP